MKSVLVPMAMLIALVSHAQTPAEFESCLAGLREQARDRGLDPRIVDDVVPALQQQERVLELDRRQPEFVKTFGEYLEARVTSKRVETGRELYARYRDFLAQLTRRYGIPGQYLIAFWGLETNFGGYLGKMPTLDSLATLACDPRRGEFFTSEFIAALQVLQRESLSADQMHGSWAGAVGHTQFMPSSYLQYAVDGDGDNTVDLWNSPKDALASGANLLKQMGWETGSRWGREVLLPEDFDFSSVPPAQSLPLSKWAALGLRRADGAPLPIANIEASLLVPSGHRGPAFLAYKNFSVIMGWNRSESYALSVAHLADRIAGAGRLYKMPPEDQRALSRDEMEALQLALNRLGYQAGEADGVFGPSTRAALINYQKDSGLVSDGFPDGETLQQLLSGKTVN